MTEICNDLIIKELHELKSKTCNTMKSKLGGCSKCKFNLEIINNETEETSNICIINLTVGTIREPDVRKIKGVY